MSRAAFFVKKKRKEKYLQLKFISTLLSDREHRRIIQISIHSVSRTRPQPARLISMQVSPHMLGK